MNFEALENILDGDLKDLHLWLNIMYDALFDKSKNP